MEKVSQTLRRAREQKKISREEAAQQTHIPLPYLMILEGEFFDSRHRSRLLPDPFYLIPYLQRYATFLNLDANFAVSQFTNEIQDTQGRQEKTDALNQSRPRLGPPPQRSRAISLSIVLAVILVTLALIGQYSDLNIGTRPQGENSSSAPPTSTLTGNPRLAPTPTEPPETNTASAQPQTSLPPSLPFAHLDSQEPSVSPDNSETSTTPLTQAPQASSPVLDSARTDAIPLSPTASLTSSPDTPTHRLLVQAKETTWIRVLIEGQSPREVILKPGQSAEWTSDSGFSVTLGNAGGVTLTVDGQELPILGKSGQVLRNIRLPFSTTEQ